MKRLDADNEGCKLTESALERLMEYNFPGNVRELENILERAVTLCSGNSIKADDIFLPKSSPVSQNTVDQQSAVPERGSLPLEDFLQEVEKQAIMEALKECRWNKTATAKKLGISFRSLRYKLEKLELE